MEDYNTVNDASPPLNETAAADLYAELATGAESGWDYSVRWVKYAVENVTDNESTLRGLNVRSIIPTDLNSLLAGDHALVSARPLPVDSCLTAARGSVQLVLQHLEQRHL